MICGTSSEGRGGGVGGYAHSSSEVMSVEELGSEEVMLVFKEGKSSSVDVSGVGGIGLLRCA